MAGKTDTYLNGMDAVNDFFELLYSTMQGAIPEALLSTTASWGWRGYRIDQHPQLAKGQYYCQIYTDKPKCLKFQEAYKEPRSGKYRYPKTWDLNLESKRFFHIGLAEQKALLHDFLVPSIDEAVKWQTSDKRRIEVHPEFIDGKRPPRQKRDAARSVSKPISDDYLTAFPLQNSILGRLEALLRTHLPEVSDPEDTSQGWLRMNANWRNWKFRGWRLRTREAPSTRANYLWEIYFERPNHLICNEYDGTSREPTCNPFDIKATQYFDLPEYKQDDLLLEFIMKALS